MNLLPRSLPRPIEPEKTILVRHNRGTLTFPSHWKPSFVVEIIEQLKSHIEDFPSHCIELDVDEDYSKISFHFYVMTKEENPRYEEQLKSYNEGLKLYEATEKHNAIINKLKNIYIEMAKAENIEV